MIDKKITKQGVKDELDIIKNITAKLDEAENVLSIAQDELNDALYALTIYLHHLNALPKRNEKGEDE